MHTKQYFRNISYFKIRQFYRRRTFMEKIQTRAYTFDDLVGSCGGFIGLFLGYALIQIPELIEFACHIVKKRYSLFKFSQSLRKEAKEILELIHKRIEFTYQIMKRKNKIDYETYKKCTKEKIFYLKVLS